MCVCVRVCVRACVRACLRACVCACACVCVTSNLVVELWALVVVKNSSTGVCSEDWLPWLAVDALKQMREACVQRSVCSVCVCVCVTCVCMCV